MLIVKNKYYILRLLFFTILVVPIGCKNPVDSVINSSSIILYDHFSDISVVTDTASILDVKIKDDVLNVTIVYKGGYAQHEFKLYGWTGILKSNPPQAEITLGHDANNDSGKIEVRGTLLFDLTPLKLSYKSRFHEEHGPLYLRIYDPGRHKLHIPLVHYEF